MARYVCLILFAFLSVSMDCFFLDLVGIFPSQNRNWDALPKEDNGASDESPETDTEIKPGPRFFLIKMMIFFHAVGTVVIIYDLWRKLRRNEKEVRLAKAETKRAHDALFKKTADQMKWMRLTAESTKTPMKALKENHTNINSNSRDTISLG